MINNFSEKLVKQAEAILVCKKCLRKRERDSASEFRVRNIRNILSNK